MVKMDIEAPNSQNESKPATTDSYLAFFLGARAALMFLTRIPCGKGSIEQASLNWAPAWFPVVGYVLGFLGGLVLTGLDRAGSAIAAIATVAVLALLTGAFHEDGLADTADAMGGASDREKLLTILKDSRIGSFGATALILVLALRIAALAKLGPLAVGGLLLAETVSRALPVWLMAALPYVTPPESSRSSAVVQGKMIHALIASVFAAAAIGLLVFGRLLAPQPILVATVLAIIATVICGWRFSVRAGGITGDFLGATQQITNALILVGLAAST
jgi:adenosylcobinamide-GDP ribazoletransferase